MLKTIQGEEGMSCEALGSPHSCVVVARGRRVGDGRADTRAARERGRSRCMVAVVARCCGQIV